MIILYSTLVSVCVKEGMKFSPVISIAAFAQNIIVFDVNLCSLIEVANIYALL